jgi:uncharacterized membrane protein (DUF106 family)
MSSLEWLASMPSSTILILGVSLLLSFLVSLINRISTGKEKLEQMRVWRKEVNTWLSDFNKARRTGDKKLLKKVQKQEKRIKQVQSKMASQSFGQMKIMPITMALFLIIWFSLTGRLLYWQLVPGIFSNLGTVVAYLPWFGSIIPLNLFYWYLISSFAFGVLFSRLFGLGMGETE